HSYHSQTVAHLKSKNRKCTFLWMFNQTVISPEIGIWNVLLSLFGGDESDVIVHLFSNQFKTH
ncbi:hypothetical protein ACTK78_004624, partial [Escherichia albertii]